MAEPAAVELARERFLEMLLAKETTTAGVPTRDTGRRDIKKIRQRPTLPRGFPRSTIGSGGLNFRVRDGNGWDPSDVATGKALLHTKGREFEFLLRSARSASRLRH